MFFPEQILSVEEDVGELLIPVHRSGDISQELMVVCSTQQGTDRPFFLPHPTRLPSEHPVCLPARLVKLITSDEGCGFFLKIIACILPAASQVTAIENLYCFACRQY